MKVLKVVILGALLGPFVAVSALLLFWMGRPLQEQAQRNLVVDDELLADDPGVDIDSGEDNDSPSTT